MSKITSIGGQALIEGIMMLGPNKISAAFSSENGEISVEDIEFHFMREKYPVLKLPFIRGVFNFVDTMRLSMKAMSMASDKIEIEESESKFEKWIEKNFGDKLMKVILALGAILGFAISLLLFVYLPILAFSGISMLVSSDINAYRSLTEGIIRMAIFILYVYLISLIPDIKRVFMYHGAEHKTIFCYENELPLTVENVRIQKRLHPRCGTSFLVIMIVLGIIVGLFIPFTNPIIRTLAKVITIPLVISLGYELIKLCGKHNNIFTKIIATPGMWVQKITTKEPDDKMIETAIAAMQSVIPENDEDIIK